MSNTLITSPIHSLPTLGGNSLAFWIPAYQRGYRWKKNDVTKLLDDLKEFIEEEKQGNQPRPFYCLQPLVVRINKELDCWEVVDGQQRLTTLFLIWKCLNDHDHPLYELSYETRESSGDFLKAPIAKEHTKHSNIDFHHIYHAHAAIEEWFQDNGTQKECFKELLANADPNGRNVRFIWYELDPGDDPVAAFTRLNAGKIPLTDVELIRALFLRNSDGGKTADRAFQHRLSLEWDRIESALQAPDFWGFLSNQTASESGRIRLLFKLCASKDLKFEYHALFLHYEEKSKAGELQDAWQQIVATFEQLEEWYRDPVLFHIVGFITTILGNKTETELSQLLEDTKDTRKSEFAPQLRMGIHSRLLGKFTSVDEFVKSLDYQEDPTNVRKTLALFNVATLLRTEGIQSRFPFHLYHKNTWDIEHVQSQAGDRIGNRESQTIWLQWCADVLRKETGSQPLLDEIEAFKSGKPEPAFEDLQKVICEYFGESDESEHGINNLTLLDSSTNRAYGNAPFPVKRAWILKNEAKGTFVLPCTRDLFLKVFSHQPGNLWRWDVEEDGNDHIKAICKTLESFFGKK